MKLGLLIEAYQEEHGRFPDTFDEIATAHSLVVKDPFTGEPLIFRVDDGDFLLYSVGGNETDEGGRHNYGRGDIVWRGERVDIPRPIGSSSSSPKRKPGWSSGDAIGG